MDYTLLPRGEKELPTTHSTQESIPRNRNKRSSRILTFLIFLLIALTLSITPFSKIQTNFTAITQPDSDKQTLSLAGNETCPQFPAIKVERSGEKGVLMESLGERFGGEGFKKDSVERMRRAIAVPTMSFDDMGEVGEDERWAIFEDFRGLLEEMFPLVHEKLAITKVNTHGLVFEWKGFNESLKPYVFMAHQDVVPVPLETVDRWTYPPFSGHFDGEFIWGRGASDCKNNLIGIMEAMETLLSLENTWQPKRTIVAAFGFDEEISGWHGAKYIAEYLEERFGKGGVEMVVDEGGLGLGETWGRRFALPALGEKGYFDVKITVETEGGHSSVPPAHTGIGMLSKIVSVIEDHPHSPELTPANPFFTTLQCNAEYSPSIPSFLRSSIKASAKSKIAAKALALHIASTSPLQKYLMQTSQATDLISGGVKINALPEKVSAVVNHRVAIESSISDVARRLTHIIQMTIAQPYHFELVAFGKAINTTHNDTIGRITLENFDEPLEPAPVSPLDTQAYSVFSGTIKQVLGEDIIVAPSIMTGNTDTKYFWNLTRNIYRFTPVEDGGRFNAHAVDERVSLKGHLDGVKFYSTLMVNGDL